MTRPTVIQWRNRYASGGIAALGDLDRSGRPPVIDDAAVVIATLSRGAEVPARYRGVIPAGGRGTPIAYLWTAKWSVPADAATGVVRFKAIAKDNKGRTAEWTVFPNEEAAQLTIVE